MGQNVTKESVVTIIRLELFFEFFAKRFIFGMSLSEQHMIFNLRMIG